MLVILDNRLRVLQVSGDPYRLGSQIGIQVHPEYVLFYEPLSTNTFYLPVAILKKESTLCIFCFSTLTKPLKIPPSNSSKLPQIQY